MLSVTVCVRTRIYRDGLVRALGALDGIEHVTPCESIAHLQRLSTSQWSDVALVDLQSCHNSATAIAELRTVNLGATHCSLVVLGLPDDDDDTVVDLLAAGAAGYVTTSDSIEDLARVLFAAARGELSGTPRLIRMMQERLLRQSSERNASSTPAVTLSRRERQVIDLASRGRSNKEIARQLCIELPTVKNHMHNVISKLQVRNRHEAVRVLGES